MTPSSIAVIGAGLIGRKHIEVLRAHRPDATLAAVCDPSPSAAAEAQQLGYPIYASLPEMLDLVLNKAGYSYNYVNGVFSIRKVILSALIWKTRATT